MDAVTVSPKYQVVIPRSVRERVHIQPGERLQVRVANHRVADLAQQRDHRRDRVTPYTKL